MAHTFSRKLISAAATANSLIAMTDQTTEAVVAAGDPAVLLAKWEGPYGGVPPFDKVRVEDFKPAMEAAMAENLAEIDKIMANSEKPTFENTIAAMERTGRALDRIQTIYGIWG